MKNLRTWVEIDAQALGHNVAEFRKLVRRSLGEGGRVGPKVRLMAVIKSNAYGHGLTQVAKFLSNDPRMTSNNSRIAGFEKNSIVFEKDSRKSLWFGVDSIVEALRLRREGIKNHILVLGYTLPSRLAEAARKHITLTVSHFGALEALARAKKRSAFHLKLDTGMHRQGFQECELPELVAALKKFRLAPEGVYSHFAAAENRKSSHLQIASFERMLAGLHAAGIRPATVHLAATGGAIRYPNARYDMVRIGLGLYGYLPDGRKGMVKPVMMWKTIAGEVKKVKKGDYIGYDLTERLKRDSTIAILPIGYWYGFDRGLSSIGEVLIHGRRCKVMGRVSMDMTAVDVTNINRKLKAQSSTVKIGDEVVIIGRQGREFIGADEMAGKIGTTAYEILTRINPLVRRIAV